MAKLKLISLAILSAFSFYCTRTPETETYTLDDIRKDTAYISLLNEVASEAIGEGAQCLDPVWHLFSYDNRRWLLSEDWGGVLEIPAGFIPLDDPNQVELSFHGTTAYMPDSSATIGFSAAYQPTTSEQFDSLVRDLFIDDRVEECDICCSTLSFPDGTYSPSYTVDAIFDDGSRGYFRYIYADGNKVTYLASATFASSDSIAPKICSMIDRFPFGPDGRHYIGLALRTTNQEQQ